MMVKKIGDIVSGLDFSIEEMDRIGILLLENKSLPSVILETKTPLINDQKFWRIQHKRFKVTGFRIGHPTAKQMIYQKLADGLKKTSGSKNHEIWQPYRICAVYYVRHELSNLNKLLSHEDFVEKSGNLTEQIFKNILQHAPLYEVTEESIRQLYDIWGFDRCSNFDSLFNNNTTDLSLVKRLIEAECNKLQKTITAKLEEIEKKVNSHLKIDSIRIEENQTEIKNLENKITSSLASFKKDILAKVTDLKESIKLSEEKFQLAKENLSSKELQSMTLIKSQVSNNSKLIEKLENTLKNLIKDEIIERENKNHPISVKDILPIWRNILNSYSLNEAEDGLLLLLISFLKSGNLFLIDRPEILISLLCEIPGLEINNIAASPLWLTESDWESQIKYIESYSSKMKIIVLSNFDDGLQESYLIPFLTRWLRTEYSKNTKIILVPSKNSSAVSPRIFGLSITLNFNGIDFNSLNEYGKIITSEFNSNDVFNESLPDSLGLQRKINFLAEQDLKRLLQDDKIPSSILMNFTNLQDKLKIYFKDNRANTLLAAQLVLYPWLKAEKGEIKCRVIEERFKSLYGVRLDAV